jgi:dTDP-4-amino-4,6-dideoxygalactose transaminase
MNNRKSAHPKIFLSPPHLSCHETQFVQQAFDSNYIAPLGPQVDAFEKEFSEHVGLKHCVALSSGTAAMHLALNYLGVGPGDEVFASTLTFIGSVSPVIFQGATPVFIDADPGAWNLSPDLLADALATAQKSGRLPKAVIPTDLYGQCADYDRLQEICNAYNVPLVIDAAEALGATYKSRAAGNAGAAAVYSFNGNKIITTSGGGMLASHDPTLIEKARFLSQQARDPAPHYQHSEIGFNYRMSNILAAIGRGQLKALEDRVAQKRDIFHYYSQALKDIPGIDFMPEAAYGTANRWLTVILITPDAFGADRETLRLALEKENIESRPVWKPMHLQPVFQIDGRNSKDNNQGKKTYPARVIGGSVSEDIFNRGLCLPSGTALSRDELKRIIDIILDCRKG